MVSEGKRWEVRVKRWMFGGLRVIPSVCGCLEEAMRSPSSYLFSKCSGDIVNENRY